MLLMLSQILAHTPKWVFALLATLVWVGIKQLLGGSVSLVRVTILPIVMTGLSILGVASAFGDSPLALVAWAAAAGLSLTVVLQRRVPDATRYDVATRQFELPGSAVPLVLMMGIFFTKYVVGVTLAMHPELGHQASMALGVSALFGLFSGIFTARAVRLWRLAIRSHRADPLTMGTVRA